MIRIIGLTIAMALCFCDIRFAFAAQEAAGQAMPVSETKRETSLGVPINMTPNDENRIRLSQQFLNKERLKNENGVDVTPPFPVSMPVAVTYPRKAVRKGWEGQTVIAAEILPDGAVGRTALAKSSGHKDLDNAAQDAVRTWKFASESGSNAAVPQYVDIPVTFKLRNED